jgi:myo-inositol-1(or 4)-monophosphatase
MIVEIKKIIKEAGNIMLQAQNIESVTESKQGRANFVTKYDVEVQNFLYKHLSLLLPQADFLGEEDLQRKASDSEYCFIIDPIDGTTNFIFDQKHSAISVALMHKNEIEIGIVYNPYSNEFFYAEKGKGVFLNEKPLKTGDLSLTEGVAGFGTSPYYSDKTDETFSIIKKLFENSLDIRRTGSAALDLSYVAAGRFVLFFELILSPWDFAAASLIVKEAGGVITTIDQKEITFNSPCSIVAAAPRAYQDFFKLIKAE